MAGKYTAHHPPLPDKPGGNWVSRAGGLPGPIDATARALVAKGYSTSHAIATAVNAMKKTCSSGRAFGGKVQVTPEAKAKACAAVSRWEAMKAEASIVSDERMVVEMSRVELAWNESQHPRHGKGKTGGGRFAPGSSASGFAKSKGAVTRVPAKTQVTAVVRAPAKAQASQQRSKVVRSGRKALKALGQRYAKPRKVAPGKTADHVAAGLHRIGKAGTASNSYVDREGRLFHRVGEGKASSFAPGLPNRPKAKSKADR